MYALHISLRCLGHPATLLSIGLLVFNDHVLKAASPSWLTGKLSDFAGLFFFPFLLAVLLSLALDELRLPPRRTGWLAFGLTALWFTLMKTSPQANALTETVLSHVLGVEAQIVLDPTDLIALTALWPARRLWAQAERITPNWMAWVGLGLASLATMATSCPPVQSVQRVVAVDDTIYASLTYYLSGGERQIARSDNGGQTWTMTTDVSLDISREAARDVSLPVTMCDPANPQVCYRTGEAVVERTEDGGQTWRADWSIPWGRRSYMDRHENAPLRVCGKQIDLGPYDMALITRNGTHTLIVAMGNEGVAVRTADGGWQRYAVLGATPTPFAATDLLEPLSVLLPETGIWLIIGILTLLVMFLHSWRVILRGLKRTLSPARSASWATRPARYTIVFLVGGIILIMVLESATDRLFMQRLTYLIPPALLLLLAVISVPISLILTWRRVASVSPQPGKVWKAAGWSVLTAMAVILVGWGPLFLWAFGAIPAYEIALPLAVVVTIWVLYRGYRRVKQSSQLAGTPMETAGA